MSLPSVAERRPRTRPSGGFSVEIEIPYQLDTTRPDGVKKEAA